MQYWPIEPCSAQASLNAENPGIAILRAGGSEGNG